MDSEHNQGKEQLMKRSMKTTWHLHWYFLQSTWKLMMRNLSKFLDGFVTF